MDGLNPRDKPTAVRNYITYMLARTNRMFEYEGLPDTIPARTLELYLQTMGYCGVVKVHDELYCMYGGLGGELDANYMPTVFTVANPYLKYSANLKIGEECVIIPSDTNYIGLMPLNRKYAAELAENDLTLHMLGINSRIPFLISASDDNTKESALKFLHDVEDGKSGVIAESAFLDGIKLQSGSTSTHAGIMDFVEYEQYLKASWNNELGLQSNYNMKRERLNSSETGMNLDALLPLVDDMLECRKAALEKVNSMFGTNITVEKAGAWDHVEEITEQKEGESNVDEPTDSDTTD